VLTRQGRICRSAVEATAAAKGLAALPIVTFGKIRRALAALPIVTFGKGRARTRHPTQRDF